MTQTKTHHQDQPDTRIKTAVVEELSLTPSIDSTHIGVSVDGGAVTLSGEVESYPQKRDAERAVQRVKGVKAIAQEITVQSVYATVTDSDIAREAGEAIEKTVDIPGGAVHVVVHDRVVTLTGVLPWHFQRESASRAVHYLRGVTDVRNLVTIKPTVSTRLIKDEIAAGLIRNATLEGQQCTVTADAEGAVTIAGTVESWSERREAEQVAWSVAGVTAVHNILHVRN